MNGITHKQAKRHMRADLDGLLNAHQRLGLHTHLRECDACRAESESLASLAARLQSGFHNRWDKQNGPSTNVMANVHSQTPRIMMTRRINTGLRAMGGVAALLVLMLAINSIISQVRNVSVATNGIQSTEDGTPVFSSQTDNRLIAFTREVDGNFDIYTMHADGSGLTNITNNPAHDSSPFWSPDGKRIAFESDRDGFKRIYLMNADGSNIAQVTDNEANHSIGGRFNDVLNPWSPDGNKLIFTEQASGEDKWMLYTVGMDGKNKTLLTQTPDIYSGMSWSPDGEHIAYIVLEPQENLPENRELFRIYIVGANGNNLTNITKLLPTDEDIGGLNYFWSNDGQSIFFIADRYVWENNNSKSTFYEASLDGNSLVEIDHAGAHIIDQWEGTSFIQAMASMQPLTWLRYDGTNSVLNAYENCGTSDIQYGPRYKRASNGDLIIAAGCANNDWWFYWANPDGTVIQQLLNSPVSSYINGHADAMAWSPDDKFVAFNMISSDKSAMYILNVSEALKDPSIQPVQITLGEGFLNYGSPVWQPKP